MLQRQVLAQVADLLTTVLTTDPETASAPVDSAAAPTGPGSAINIIQQRALQESHLPVPCVPGLLAAVPAVDPAAAPSLVAHQSCPLSDQAGDTPIRACEAGPPTRVPLQIQKQAWFQPHSPAVLGTMPSAWGSDRRGLCLLTSVCKDWKRYLILKCTGTHTRTFFFSSHFIPKTQVTTTVMKILELIRILRCRP